MEAAGVTQGCLVKRPFVLSVECGYLATLGTAVIMGRLTRRVAYIQHVGKPQPFSFRHIEKRRHYDTAKQRRCLAHVRYALSSNDGTGWGLQDESDNSCMEFGSADVLRELLL